MPTGTGPLDFGHFSREVPKTLHIRAYPSYSSVSPLIAAMPKTAANAYSCGARLPDDLAIAMQKVEGSNPFSRFFPANHQLFSLKLIGSAFFVRFWALKS